MHYTEIGRYAKENLEQLHTHYPDCEITESVVMPNHIHIIVGITRKDDVHISSDTAASGATQGKDDVHIVSPSIAQTPAPSIAPISAPSTPYIPSTDNNTRWKNETVNEKMQSISHRRGRLSVAIGGFKRAVTRYANQSAIPFGWQERFHDHIIRNQGEYDRIAAYIRNNPKKWDEDKFTV